MKRLIFGLFMGLMPMAAAASPEALAEAIAALEEEDYNISYKKINLIK